MEIGLVSCTKSKRSEIAPPRDLYDKSALFRRARAYSEQNHDTWYILSAKHYLLSPSGPPIEPYNETLSRTKAETREKWAKITYRQLNEEGVLTEGNTIVFHAGRDYYEKLLPLLENDPVEVHIPTEGLTLGETLAWYSEVPSEAEKQ